MQLSGRVIKNIVEICLDVFHRHLAASMGSYVIGRNNWESVSSAQEFWNWADLNLICPWKIIPTYLTDSTALAVGLEILGSVRIRQVRSKKIECEIPSFIKTDEFPNQCIDAKFGLQDQSKRTLQWFPQNLSNTTNADNVDAIQLAR
jgi:hypothetical protein